MADADDDEALAGELLHDEGAAILEATPGGVEEDYGKLTGGEEAVLDVCGFENGLIAGAGFALLELAVKGSTAFRGGGGIPELDYDFALAGWCVGVHLLAGWVNEVERARGYGVGSGGPGQVEHGEGVADGESGGEEKCHEGAQDDRCPAPVILANRHQGKNGEGQIDGAHLPMGKFQPQVQGHDQEGDERKEPQPEWPGASRDECPRESWSAQYYH